MFTIGELRVISQMTQNNKYNKWLEILDFQAKLLWRTPTKIHRKQRRRWQQEAPPKAQRTSLSTAKATSSTQRPQTCTESATKYYNYTTNRADKERTPTADASKSDGEIRQRLQFTVKFLRCYDRQQQICASRISFQRTEDSLYISLYTMSNIGFYSKFYFTMNGL